MLFCNHCNKEVIIYGVSIGTALDDQLVKMRKKLEKEGKLILFNPPPFGPYSCPKCFNKLEET